MNNCYFCLCINRVTDPSQKENLGIIVHYKVKVKLCLGPLGGDVVAELPFILMHPKPLEEPAAQSSRTDETSNHNRSSVKPTPEDHNLIQLDAYVNPSLLDLSKGLPFDFLLFVLFVLNREPNEEDIIFEDFARLRLRGETADIPE
jgi:beta-arrestin